MRQLTVALLSNVVEKSIKYMCFWSSFRTNKQRNDTVPCATTTTTTTTTTKTTTKIGETEHTTRPIVLRHVLVSRHLLRNT